MDSNPNTGPQIRSRITVVCAECKRLKLKCDRRAPCGSCTKRDTVVRCIYSPAAAEKVDLHSLNNRLIQVESTLALITAGVTPPVFQPNYPLPQVPAAAASASAQASGSSHHHHHHYAVTPSTSQSLALDIKATWLDDLQPHLPPKQPVKQEPDTISISQDAGAPFVRRPGPHRTAGPSQLLLPALSIYYPVHSIPPPDSSPSNETAYMSAFSHSAGSSTTDPQTQQLTGPTSRDSTPQVTSGLLALLPSGDRCKSLLGKAREVLRVRPVPFLPCAFYPSEAGCLPKRRKAVRDDEEEEEEDEEEAWRTFERRCWNVLGITASSGKDKEKERMREEKKRAREIYFAGVGGAPAASASAPSTSPAPGLERHLRALGLSKDGAEPRFEESLAFFGLMCAVLAVGACCAPPSAAATVSPTSSMKPSPNDSAEFLYALSQQALGVWDTHISTLLSSSGKERDEMDRLESVLASLVGVSYLLLDREGVEDDNDDGRGRERITQVVGKMINSARNMGLGRDVPARSGTTGRTGHKSRASTVSSTGKDKDSREEKKEEWRRLLWWDVLFYDLFTADALGQQPFLPPYSYSTRSLPVAYPASQHTFDDANAADTTTDVSMSLSSEEHASRPPTQGPQMPPKDAISISSEPRSLARQMSKGTNTNWRKAYLVARCRLTSLAQRVGHALAHPACCCGYTIDQALGLEGELRSWIESLPSVLNLDTYVDTDETDSKDRKYHHAYSAELSVVSNLLAIKIWSPFVHRPGVSPSSSTASTMNVQAAKASVQGALGILRAVRALTVMDKDGLASTSGRRSLPFPTAFSFFPLLNVTWDTTVICARVALYPPTSSSAFDLGFGGKDLKGEVKGALNTLSTICKFTGSDGCFGVGTLGEEEVEAAEGMWRLFVLGVVKPTQHSLLGSLQTDKARKRKHDQVEPGSPTPLRNGHAPTPSLAYDATYNLGPSLDSMSLPYEHSQTGPMDAGHTHPGYLHDSAPSSSRQSPHGYIAQVYESHPTASPQMQLEMQNQHLYVTSTQVTDDLNSILSSSLRSHLAEKKSEKGKDRNGDDRKRKSVAPHVGIRLRLDDDGTLVRPSRERSPSKGIIPPGPLMTSTPRPLPSNGAVTGLQQLAEKVNVLKGRADSSLQGGQDARIEDAFKPRSNSLTMGLGGSQLHGQSGPGQAHLPSAQPHRMSHQPSGMDYSGYGHGSMVEHVEITEASHGHGHGHRHSHGSQSYQAQSQSQPPPPPTQFDHHLHHPAPAPPSVYDPIQSSYESATSVHAHPAPDGHHSAQNQHQSHLGHGEESHSQGVVPAYTSSPDGYTTSPYASGQVSTPPVTGGTPAFGHGSSGQGGYEHPQSRQRSHLHAPSTTGSDSASNPSASPAAYFHTPHGFSTTNTSVATSPPGDGTLDTMSGMGGVTMMEGYPSHGHGRMMSLNHSEHQVQAPSHVSQHSQQHTAAIGHGYASGGFETTSQEFDGDMMGMWGSTSPTTAQQMNTALWDAGTDFKFYC